MTEKGSRIRKIPEGDSHERLVCVDCDHIDYDNPKIINVVVPVYHDPVDGTDKYLLCRRAIEPRKGYWTLPGGYMEKRETLQEGAHREAEEEAGADITVGALIAIWQPPNKDHVVMIFRGELDHPHFESGPESLETQLFKWEDIPWKDIAFGFVWEGLKAYKEMKGKTDFQPKMIVSPPYKPLPPGTVIKPPSPPKP